MFILSCSLWMLLCVQLQRNAAAMSPRNIFSHKQIHSLPLLWSSSLGKSPMGELGEILFSSLLVSPAVFALSVHLNPPQPFLQHKNNLPICCNQTSPTPLLPSFIWVHILWILSFLFSSCPLTSITASSSCPSSSLNLILALHLQVELQQAALSIDQSNRRR